MFIVPKKPKWRMPKIPGRKIVKLLKLLRARIFVLSKLIDELSQAIFASWFMISLSWAHISECIPRKVLFHYFCILTSM